VIAAASSPSADRDALKRAAAEAAVQLVENDMVVGLGSGSTAAFAIEALARRRRRGLRFVGIPTSERAAAQAAAAEALKHQDVVERRVTETLAARMGLEQEVRELGLWVAESDANFIWTRLPDGVEEEAVVTGLRERGVLVRAGASLGREGALRVTVGLPEENRRFTAALGELLSGKGLPSRKGSARTGRR
jgi:DNA-binding transcriptional MocR family regulator